MQSLNIDNLIEIALLAAHGAGKGILDIYSSHEGDFSVKSDNSPLTKADRVGHDAIIKYLAASNIPVLSEEGKSIPYETRKDWDYYWLIDPLDGTKEFLKRNGEFTVNIALIHKGTPILGVVYAPVLGDMYWGVKGVGAFLKKGEGEPTILNIKEYEPVKAIVASRSHMSSETEAFILNYPDATTISMGSSLKFLLVAEGKAQIYPRFAPTMEWDTAAAQAVVEAAGGIVVTYPDLKPLSYNRANMLNDWFICCSSKELLKIF